MFCLILIGMEPMKLSNYSKDDMFSSFYIIILIIEYLERLKKRNEDSIKIGKKENGNNKVRNKIGLQLIISLLIKIYTKC